jgi:hypothetical protein
MAQQRQGPGSFIALPGAPISPDAELAEAAKLPAAPVVQLVPQPVAARATTLEDFVLGLRARAAAIRAALAEKSALEAELGKIEAMLGMVET